MTLELVYLHQCVSRYSVGECGQEPRWLGRPCSWTSLQCLWGNITVIVKVWLTHWNIKNKISGWGIKTDRLPCSPLQHGRWGVPILAAGTPPDCGAAATLPSPRGSTVSANFDFWWETKIEKNKQIVFVRKKNVSEIVVLDIFFIVDADGAYHQFRGEDHFLCGV